ncbi:MAG: hypothetical protein MK074_04440 [Phycisphaerales bacterium]|nr:hypothetical protein [Phycisphaerales bacterium]
MSRDDLPVREGDDAPSEVDSTSPKPPVSMPMFIGVLLLADMAILGVILAAVFMKWPFTGWIIGVLTVAFLLCTMRAAISLLWNRMVAPWPPIEPTADAQRRRFQSFRMQLMNLGLCVHVTKDQTHLHLRLIGLLRVFGAVDASIPWDAITMQNRKRARIGTLDVWGPPWAFERPADH